MKCWSTIFLGKSVRDVCSAMKPSSAPYPPGTHRNAVSNIANRDRPSLFGIGGWLKFFAYSQLTISPLYTLMFDLSLWVPAIQAVRVDSNPARAFQLLPYLLDIIFFVYGICVSIIVLNNSPHGKESAQEFLVLRLFWQISVLAIVIAWGCGFNGNVGKIIVVVGYISMLQATFFSSIWLAYFAKSRQVQIT
jgi:hypothetical protein